MEWEKRVKEIKERIDLKDSQMVMQYGSGARQEIADSSERILAHLQKRQSTEPIGDLLDRLLRMLRESEEIFSGEKGSVFLLFFGENGRIRRFRSRYERVEGQMDLLAGELEGIRMELLKSAGIYDVLYRQNRESLEKLQCYIEAGEKKISEVREQVLPGLRKKAEESRDYLQIQEARDWEESLNRFEKKITGLKTSETIAMQIIPQLKLIQNQDRLLAERIQEFAQELIPLWKNQASLALGIERGGREERRREYFSEGRGILRQANQVLTASAEEILSVQREERESQSRAGEDFQRMKEEMRGTCG